MSTVCVLTPIVIGSWPAISSAILGAAGAMGFSVAAGSADRDRASGRQRIEIDVPDSEVLAEALERGQKVCIERDGVTVEFGVDERGALSACVSGEGRSKSELRKIGDEVTGRVIQQFAYHKLMTELKARHYDVVQESVEADDSIQVRVRLGR